MTYRRARCSREEGQKGIRRQLMMPGRYPFNPYAETIELHDPVTIPAGARGVVTLLAGKEPKDPNVFLVDTDERGVQKPTLPPGRYPVNPYEKRISIVDCRSKKFHLGQDMEMDFLSADGFPVTLDGVVEFRVIETMASEVFVKYNEDDNGDVIDDEIISKIITPESRSLCRTGGSKLNGGQFITGNDREVFQRNLVTSLSENCKKQGIEILAVAITSIQPPEDIAGPVRAREVAKQELNQYSQEKIQQLSRGPAEGADPARGAEGSRSSRPSRRPSSRPPRPTRTSRSPSPWPSRSSRSPRPAWRHRRTRRGLSSPRPRPTPRSSGSRTRPRSPASRPASRRSTAMARPWPRTF